MPSTLWSPQLWPPSNRSNSSPRHDRPQYTATITEAGERGLLYPVRGRASPASPHDEHDGEEVGDQRAQAEPPRRVGGEAEGDPELRHQSKERQPDHEDHRI